jgi:hypothetical protein
MMMRVVLMMTRDEEPDRLSSNLASLSSNTSPSSSLFTCFPLTHRGAYITALDDHGYPTPTDVLISCAWPIVLLRRAGNIISELSRRACGWALDRRAVVIIAGGLSETTVRERGTVTKGRIVVIEKERVRNTNSKNCLYIEVRLVTRPLAAW